MTTKIEVSLRTLITIVLFALSIWALFSVRDVIILILVAFILASALSPLVTRLESRRVPRLVAILIIYIISLLIFGGLVAAIIPLFVSQIVNLINNFPAYLAEIASLFGNTPINSEDFINTLSGEVTAFSRNIFQFTLGVFSGVLSFITVAVLTFYLLVDEKNLRSRLQSGLPESYNGRVTRILEVVQTRLGAWVRGQLILSLIIGTMYFVGLTILGIPYSLALGIIAGMLEVVPVMGPIIAAIPAILIALTKSPVLAIGVIALFFVIQQLENHLIVPKVMQRAVGLSPLVTLLALLAGGKLFGIIGIVLAVPVAVIIHVILYDFWLINERHNNHDTEPAPVQI